jgi:hypothetical protein
MRALPTGISTTAQTGGPPPVWMFLLRVEHEAPGHRSSRGAGSAHRAPEGQIGRLKFKSIVWGCVISSRCRALPWIVALQIERNALSHHTRK